ncbi:hypothetical protein [Anaerorhabdus sp.]|uniref:hypothetical protein n=1 Tax=Anaerorhabdus sp. TaxID=1872524 RepID=UPI002B1EB25C|nr:hypothetical protein [Anaerorhabdus sp.]MEA4873834.1 hypothetical protein [Anaerorhabdus sp.]
MASSVKKNSFPEFQELLSIVEHRDELRFTVAAHELFEAVQNSAMKPEKKLVVYDLISKLGNCRENERIKYLKKIGGKLK